MTPWLNPTALDNGTMVRLFHAGRSRRALPEPHSLPNQGTIA
jgi:hypothetical protein